MNELICGHFFYQAMLQLDEIPLFNGPLKLTGVYDVKLLTETATRPSLQVCLFWLLPELLAHSPGSGELP
jgi:hypothetical protein